MSGVFPRHAPTDFPTTVLVPAVHAARVQEHGLLTLRAASLAQAPLAGPRGVFAATNLGDLFDYWAAQALLDGDIKIEASPLDACLGVLPLAQLALHFWYRDHYHKELPESPLASAAARASLAPGGVLNLQLGLAEFLPLWGAALGADDEVPIPLVYYHLVCAMTRAAECTGSTTAVAIGGTIVSWSGFVTTVHTEYRTRMRGSPDGSDSAPYTLGDLTQLVNNINRFAAHRHDTVLSEADIPPPPGLTSRTVRIITPMPDTRPDPPPPAPAASDPITPIPRHHGGTGRGRHADRTTPTRAAALHPPGAPLGPPPTAAHLGPRYRTTRQRLRLARPSHASCRRR